MTADLKGKGHRLGEPHGLVVYCHPRGHGDPKEPDIGRHPTFPEVIEAADLLAPGDVFHIVFMACPVGVEREPAEVDGVQAVQADQVGEAKKSALIELATA